MLIIKLECNIPLCNSVSKEYIQFTNKNYNSYIPFYFLKKITV